MIVYKIHYFGSKLLCKESSYDVLVQNLFRSITAFSPVPRWSSAEASAPPFKPISLWLLRNLQVAQFFWAFEWLCKFFPLWTPRYSIRRQLSLTSPIFALKVAWITHLTFHPHLPTKSKIKRIIHTTSFTSILPISVAELLRCSCLRYCCQNAHIHPAPLLPTRRWLVLSYVAGRINGGLSEVSMLRQFVLGLIKSRFKLPLLGLCLSCQIGTQVLMYLHHATSLDIALNCPELRSNGGPSIYPFVHLSQSARWYFIRLSADRSIGTLCKRGPRPPWLPDGL